MSLIIIQLKSKLNVRLKETPILMTNSECKAQNTQVRKNLKRNENYKSVYVNEDLTLLRSKILFHCRQLQNLRKRKLVSCGQQTEKCVESTGMSTFQMLVQLLDSPRLSTKQIRPTRSLQNSCSCVTLLLMLTINIQFIIHCHCLVVYCLFLIYFLLIKVITS